MLDIRLAGQDEFQAVRAFYHLLIDQMEGAAYTPGWEKDVYPENDQLRQAIDRRQLYLGELAGDIAAAMILNRECNEGYRGAPWRVEAAPEEVSVIHALGVLPACQGRGLGREMVRAAVELARSQGSRVVRLDVLAGNLPAEQLYLGEGFYYVATARMFYPDTGWTDYEMYELPLRQD